MKVVSMLFVLCCLFCIYTEAQDYTLTLEYMVNFRPDMCNYYGRSTIVVYYNDISEYDPESLSIPAGTIVRFYNLNPPIPTPPVSVGNFSECTGDSDPYTGPIPEGYEPDLGSILYSHLFDIIMDQDKNIEFIFNVSSFNCSVIGPTPTPPPVINVLKGDVNEDTVIDIVDALLVAQDYVGLNPENYNPEAADTNCDGNIDIVDALLIAQYYVGLLGEFC
ncbi:MAG: dockerin type I repeat-containing protein [Spirochaetales bacterium]|nr:dockerin type I repeat-containing protein [Spirochaetales bacterium]